jgi:hypothetical protein
MSSAKRWKSVFGPGVEAAVDDVGEVALERATRLALRLPFRDLALEEGSCSWVDASLGDGDAVQAGVDLAVAATMEAVAAGARA